MSFQDFYTEATKAGKFENVYGEQNFDNTVIEQPVVMEYEEPSLYLTQLSASPYCLKAPVCTDLAKYYDFSTGHLQPSGAVNEDWDKPFTFECPTAPSRPTLISTPISQQTSLAANTPRSSLRPPQSILPKEKIGIQEEKPRKSTNYRSYDYQPLYTAPTSWDIFKYNCFGELEPGRTYSAKELVRYLYSNPQNHVGETYNPKLGGLTLWVQRTPEDFAAEYGHPEACLCRFENCEHNNLIKAGDVRVAFDELTKFIPGLNPQHNAGYVHLSCLEKKMNFPMLCKHLDVRPEARVFSLGRTDENFMILQDRTEFAHVQRFITFCNDIGRAPGSYPSQGLLIDEMLKFGPSKLNRFAQILWRKRGVEWDDEHKARHDHSKEVHKAKRHNLQAKNFVARRARAEEAKKSEAGEERPTEKIKARAIIKPRGRIRRASPTPVPEPISDSFCKTEEDEVLKRERVEYWYQ